MCLFVLTSALALECKSLVHYTLLKSNHHAPTPRIGCRAYCGSVCRALRCSCFGEPFKRRAQDENHITSLKTPTPYIYPSHHLHFQRSHHLHSVTPPLCARGEAHFHTLRPVLRSGSGITVFAGFLGSRPPVLGLVALLSPESAPVSVWRSCSPFLVEMCPDRQVRVRALGSRAGAYVAS